MMVCIPSPLSNEMKSPFIKGVAFAYIEEIFFREFVKHRAAITDDIWIYTKKKKEVKFHKL